MATTPTLGFQQTLEELGLGEGWQWDKGSWWYVPTGKLDVRATTARMLELDARFVAITATEQPDKEIRLDYQWDLEGKLLSFVTFTESSKIPTIVDLSRAADWVEREIHEYFAVEFLGRESTKPLMTRSGDAIGINLRKEKEAAQ
jgi:hypothetical protein